MPSICIYKPQSCNGSSNNIYFFQNYVGEDQVSLVLNILALCALEGILGVADDVMEARYEMRQSVLNQLISINY